MSAKSIFVVAGVGNGAGTGGAVARAFSQAGYRVALIARNAESLKKTAEELNAAGGEATAFPVNTYDYASFASVFESIRSAWPGSPVRAAVFNVGHGVRKPFLETTEEDVRASLDTNTLAGFAFSQQAIQTFKMNDLDERGKRGTLIFTGATAAIRGNVTTSAFAAGKHGLRALSQSLAKEFGKENIHVSHAIIDGVIDTDRTRARYQLADGQGSEDKRLDANAIAESYLALTKQHRSAWTWELDLRPAHEKW